MFGDITNKEKLGNCCVLNPTLDTKLDDNLDVSFVPMSNISNDNTMNCEIKKYYELKKKGYTYFENGDVIFAKITPCMENGKGAIAKNLTNKIGFGSTEYHILRPIKNISNSYWLYILLSFNEFRKQAMEAMTGSSGHRRVPESFLKNYEINLPPILMQQQFANYVEHLDKLRFKL